MQLGISRARGTHEETMETLFESDTLEFAIIPTAITAYTSSTVDYRAGKQQGM